MSDSPVTYTTLGRQGWRSPHLSRRMNFGSAEPWMLDDEAGPSDTRRASNSVSTSSIQPTPTRTARASGFLARPSTPRTAGTRHRDESLLPDGRRAEQIGLSRKHIIDQAHATLDRLGADYIDLYQIHRWDDGAPSRRRWTALDHLVEEGLVRYVGASTMSSYQFTKALYTADVENLERFACMQPEYNAVDRHEEANLLPVCEGEGVGVVPWSPLAGGFLAGKYDRDDDVSEGRASRTSTREPVQRRELGGPRRGAAIADEKGATPAQVSLAWLLHKPSSTHRSWPANVEAAGRKRRGGRTKTSRRRPAPTLRPVAG